MSTGTLSPPGQTTAFVEQIMGLPISIHLRSRGPLTPEQRERVQECWALLREVDEVFSTWRSDSQLMRIRAGELAWEQGHPWLGALWELCTEAEVVTGGIFTADLVGPDGTRGWDPTGAVKGWAVQQASGSLRQLSGVSWCINAGGDVLCGGSAQGASSATALPSLSPEFGQWRVGIEQASDRSKIRRVIPLREGTTQAALATSGVAARGSHLVDGRTGEAPEGVRRSVSVTGPELVWADIWATACFVDPEALVSAGPRWSAYQLVDQQ